MRGRNHEQLNEHGHNLLQPLDACCDSENVSTQSIETLDRTRKWDDPYPLRCLQMVRVYVYKVRDRQLTFQYTNTMRHSYPSDLYERQQRIQDSAGVVADFLTFSGVGDQQQPAAGGWRAQTRRRPIAQSCH